MNKLDLASAGKKIDSALAKYNSVGQLFCVLCNQQVKSEKVWISHISGRVHREKLQELKSRKRPSETQSDTLGAPPPKKALPESGPLKSILVSSSRQSSSTSTPSLISTQSDVESTSLSKLTNNSTEVPGTSRSTLFQHSETVENVHMSDSTSLNGANGVEDDVDEDEGTPSSSNKKQRSSINDLSSLPEGFFDDPKLDAKVRGLEYRKPEEIEWENFVREMASEEVKSSTLRIEDDEESTVTRELDEIEEQMTHWKRVLDLEKKAEEIRKLKAMQSQDENMDDDTLDEDLEYDGEEELDWRSKRR